VVLAFFQSYGIAVGLQGAGNVVSNPGMFFLVSPLARYITGTVIPVDGGMRRYQF
jgi:preprotein translocase subunit SecY